MAGQKRKQSTLKSGSKGTQNTERSERKRYKVMGAFKYWNQIWELRTWNMRSTTSSEWYARVLLVWRHLVLLCARLVFALPIECLPHNRTLTSRIWSVRKHHKIVKSFSVMFSSNRRRWLWCDARVYRMCGSVGCIHFWNFLRRYIIGSFRNSIYLYKNIFHCAGGMQIEFTVEFFKLSIHVRSEKILRVNFRVYF